MTEHEKVEQFHKASGQPVRDTPTMPSPKERALRCRLLLEETLEYIGASGCKILAWTDGRWEVSPDGDNEPNLAAMAQENADVRYVALGNDLLMGVRGEPFEEVSAANMRKVGPDGTVQRRADGKVIKPEGWEPPDVGEVLRALAQRAK